MKPQFRYELLNSIGSGGLGHVYRGQGKVGEVALKELKPEEVTGFDPKELAELEISRLQRVPDHDNLVRFIEICRAKHIRDRNGVRRRAGGWFVVMSFVPGRTLEDEVEFGQLNPTECWQLLSQVLDGLGHMHTHGVVHRDLKPSNIIISTVDGQRRPIVVDVGLAKRLNSDKTQIVGGTRKYQPPEHRNLNLLQPSYDIYQLALIAFEAMYGDDLCDENERWDTNEMQDRLRAKGLPFYSALADGLEKDPLRRPQSVWQWIKSMVAVQLPDRVVGRPRKDNSTGPATSTLDSAENTEHSVDQGFKEATARITVKRLCGEIEEEFQLPSGSLMLCRTERIPARGNTKLETLRALQVRNSDYGKETLDSLANEIGARLGIRGDHIEFRIRGERGKLYFKQTKVKKMRSDYE